MASWFRHSSVRPALVTGAAFLLAASASPTTFEVDLIFPRNDTYMPIAVFPIVFAVHNPGLASPLDAQIYWEVSQGSNISSPGATSGLIDLRHSDSSNDNPDLITRQINSLSGINGSWLFTWVMSTGNCSQSGSQFSSGEQHASINFTTRGGAQTPDLVAATSGLICEASPNFAFNVTALNEVGQSSDFDAQPSCAVLATGPAPTGNPCVVNIDAIAASSISSALTASVCELHPPTGVQCPARSSFAAAQQVQVPWQSQTYLYVGVAMYFGLTWL